MKNDIIKYKKYIRIHETPRKYRHGTLMFFLCALISLQLDIQAATKIGGSSESTATTTNITPLKVALVIGNSDYRYASNIGNAANDALSISRKLKQLGFNVIYRQNINYKSFQSALSEFTEMLDFGAVALLYFAGHGVRNKGLNYIMPVDANIRDHADIDSQGFEVNNILSALNARLPDITIALLDTCNNNPFDLTRPLKNSTFSKYDRTQQFRQLIRGIIAYSTEPGNVAVDGNRQHSPFAFALLRRLQISGMAINDLLDRVGQEVVSVTGGRQKPWFYSTLSKKYCFAGCDADFTSPDTHNYLSKESKHIISKIKQALHNKSLVGIKKLSQLDKTQEKFLRDLFISHSSLTFAKLVPMFMPKSVYPHKVQVRILEAVNLSGNRVFPANSWSLFSINLRMPNEYR